MLTEGRVFAPSIDLGRRAASAETFSFRRRSYPDLLIRHFENLYSPENGRNNNELKHSTLNSKVTQIMTPTVNDFTDIVLRIMFVIRATLNSSTMMMMMMMMMMMIMTTGQKVVQHKCH